MRVGFAGTPDFARVALESIHQAGHTLPLVLTQPDRPAGRGLKLQASPVKQWALTHYIEVEQPRSLRLDGKAPEEAARARDRLLAADLDLLVVAAYGLILPQWVLDLPRRGCLNIHASLLPRWRGAAPIHRAIEAGDAETGITIMQMDAGLDTGAMLLRASEPIAPDDTTGTLHDRLATLGGRLIVEALNALDRLVPQGQPAEGVTYARKVDKAESAIDWRLPAAQLARRTRAFDPYPGMTFACAGETLKLWRARALPGDSERPGTVLAKGEGRWCVACGEGVLELLEIQRPGSRRCAVAQYLQGHPVPPGALLIAPG